MPSIETASNFLDTLNKEPSSVKFTMETECNGMLPFLGIQLLNRSPQIETKVYVKPTNSGLLLHYQSHVDHRYKKGLLRTMLDRAHRLSSSWTHFSDECDRLKTVFSRLKYPKHLVNSTIKSFVDSKVCDQQQPLSPSQETDDTIRVVLPFNDQISADIVRKQLKDLSLKVHTTIQPVFVSRKIEQELSVKETKPPIVNQQCVVYGFQCDLCDAGYVTVAHICKHNKQFLKHNTIFLKHKSILWNTTQIVETQHKIIETQLKIIETQHKIIEHNTKLSKHNSKLSKHNTKLSKHNTKLSKHNTKLPKHNTKLSKQHKILADHSGKPRYEGMKTRRVSNMAVDMIMVCWDVSDVYK